jgi:hypothetical protein
MSNLFTYAFLFLMSIIPIEDILNYKKKKPNVLILFADQHNKKVMGFENHPDVIHAKL